MVFRIDPRTLVGLLRLTTVMEDLQEITFEQVADERAIASKLAPSEQHWIPSSSSSLLTFITHTRLEPISKTSILRLMSIFATTSSTDVSPGQLTSSIVGASNTVLAIATESEAGLTTSSYDSRDIAKAKLKELKAKHFTKDGRERRIARALEILNLPGPSFKADKETWIWAAEDADIEDI